jgi:asparagine synthase (glutamine-hydrolysing)
LFEPHAVKTLVAEHLAGYNHSERLWALLTFEIWARITLDGNAPWTLELPTMRAAA